MTPEHLPLGSYIRALRDEQDLSLRELAKAVGCSPAFLSDVELGRRNPTDETLKRIAKELRVSVDKLKEHDTRLPIDDIRKRAQIDPRYAYALRRVLDSGTSTDALLQLVKKEESKKRK